MSNNTYTAKETSFWKFIQENEIEIPIIQRDYAQGRLGKESLRKNFLGDLKKALDNEKPYKDKAMKMDFVYGSVEHDKMNPLDGQQRLTTLWLLHWYIALHAGKLDDEVAKTLSKFTYETRISSREFCGNLCDLEHFKNFDGKDIVGFITRQTWFYSAWKQDPTIQSMLRMLGGTKVTDKKGEDIVDGIEELFEGTDNFEKYWDKLTSDNAPIVFYHLPLKDFGLSDDLYIKMNARGKQLTSFENFKADLVDYITERSESELEDAKKRKWKSLLDECEGIPIRMDTAWTDIFWNNIPQKHKIDEIYFAFLNRFFWDKLFMCKSGDKYVLDIGKGDETSTQENNNPSYKYLNNSDAGPNVYDTTISYKELDVYKFFGGKIPYSVFEDLQKVLNRYIEIPACTWDDSFRFIPAYENDSNGNSIEITDNNGEKIWKVTCLTQVHRVVFHAICKYFIEGDADTESLRQWMRVVWNLVSGEDAKGPQIRSTQAMRTAMEFIDKLDSHDVYNCLTNYTGKLSESAFDKRCKEEIAKAKQILNGTPRTDRESWEEIIIKAESYAFFKGAIRFLFTDENGDVNDKSWKDFDTKWEKAKKYIDKNGEIVEECKTDAILLRALLSRINIGENWFGYYKEFWYTSLLKNDYQSAIHYLLTTPQLEIEQTCTKDWINSDSLLQNVLCCYNSWHILNNWQGYSVLTRYSQRRSDATSHKEIIVLNDLRNKLLNEVKAEISPEIKVGDTTYLYGWNINFKYKNHFFRWYGNPNEKELDVYLMENDWVDYKKRPNHTSDKGTDEDIYYYFKVDEADSSDSFVEKLDNLIK